MAIVIDLKANAAEFEGTLTRAQRTVSQASSSMQRDLSAAERSTQQLSDRSRRHLATLERGFTSIQGAVTRLAAIIGAQQLASSFLEASRSMDRVRQSLESVTGSSLRASVEMAQLQQIAERTGAPIATLAQQWTGLFAAANGVPGRLEEARKVFIALAETAPRLGKSTDQVGLALYGLQQLVGGTTVQMQELAQQIGDALPGVLPALARELGKTEQELRKMIAQGNLLVKDTLPAMERAIRSLTTGGGPINTLDAQIGRLSTAWTNMMDAFAQTGVINLLTATLKGLTFVLKEVAQGAEGVQAILQRFGVIEGKGLEGAQNRLEAIRKEMTQIQGLIAQASRETPEERITGVVSPGRMQVLNELEAKLRVLNEEALALQQKVEAVVTPLPPVTVTSTPISEGAREAAAQQAADAARIQTKLLQERQQQELASLELMQQRRRQALEEDYQFTLNNTTRTEQNKQAIESAFNIRRLDETRRSALERTEIETRQAVAVRDARLRELDAEIGAARAKGAGSEKDAAEKANTEIAKLMGERQVVQEEYNTRIRELAQQTAKIEADFEKGLTGVVADEKEKQYQLEQARRKKEAQLRDAQLQGQAGILSAEKALVQAQVEGFVLTRQEGLQQFAALQQREFENERARLEAQAAEQIRIEEEAGRDTEVIHETLNLRLKELGIEQQAEQQSLLNEQLEAWTRFAEDAERSLASVLFDGLKGRITSLADLWSRALDFMLETFASFVAAIISQRIIIPVVLGIGGSGLGGLLSGVGGGAGGLGSLFGPQSLIGQGIGVLSNAFSAVGDMVLSAGQSLSAGINNLVFGVNAPSITTISEALSVFGGIAGIGGGIFNALTAEGPGGIAGGAVGAIGGGIGAAATLGLLPAALGPIGLALAALAPLLGNFLDTLGAPKGPRFTLGELEGLDVVVENGMLQVAGTLTSAVGKAERLPEGQSADAIQSALEAGLQQAVDTMVNTINAVALDPEALLIPTQEALETALDNALVINSASAENFANDIAAQTLAVVTQIATAFLGPLADALNQIFSAELDTQLSTLPNALNLAVAQLKQLTDAVTAIQETGQTDASNVVPQLLDQIATFRSFIIDSTIHALNDAFESGFESFDEALQLAISVPQGVIDLHSPLGQVQQISQAFAAVFGPMDQAVQGLETALTPVSDQISDLRDQFLELQQEIAEGGENIAVVLPLYAEMQQAILQEANLRIQQVQAIGQTLESIEQTLFSQLTPAEQQQQLLSDIAALEAELAGQTGSEAAQTAAELAALNQQLLALGGSTDNLALQMEAIENLEALQPLLEQQLIALGGTTDVQEAIKNIQQQTLDTLTSMQEDLYNLFLSNQQVQQALGVGPVPVVIVGSEAAQMGQLIGYANGGLVPAMLEGQERVFYPPMTMAQQGALMAMNQAFPRFGGGGMVPGYREGDTVPAMLPAGSFVLNKRASQVLSGRGYQEGGTVRVGAESPGGSPRPLTVHVHIGGTWTVQKEQDKRDLARALSREIRDELAKLEQRTFRG